MSRSGAQLSLTETRRFDRPDGSAYSRSLGTEWSLRDDDMIEAACRIVGRDLTQDEWAKYIGDSVPYRATCTAV